ncbi:bifunctional indole-3-glycerol-phosphate synthase TrpC/phosphoribosylanthranilate isomerase TrpF [Corallincola spongiicola]|uniref:Multifunctional fusion protein n=1 Tax=Corallincola spongiicola TaxID=2520508 RepID=A0ABY1WUR6_9GAMM|nr:bifunctional indole-3-glycerol-phosphate synthase TrpC/phosphoribosylanthranilate isomerase TrpF [Corallincola spongiicola]TAA48504.1 bifunctional indole-3-glycerol-phosphate synthase TrpC/phosphoribosylanthranilate isomerase TrpF [Corallincola spongiicola]
MTETVLDRIVKDKRELLVELKLQRPLDTFIDQLTPSDRSFYDALSEPNAGFILECKKASPSKGLIRPEFELDYIASVYTKYAAAISVLTDEKYFQGKLAYLKQVRDQVTQPVLHKDFIVDPYQIYLGRLHGSDAVLLMLSVLDDEEYKSLHQVADSLQVDVLTEVSNQEEMNRAIALGSKVIGINNRNLRDLSISLDKTKFFAPQVPDDRIVISESGIYQNSEVRELATYVDGFLVGSSLMSQPDVDMACRNLIFGHHKVCGLTHKTQAELVKENGATYGGLIFFPGSPRAVSEQQAAEITTVDGLKFVGVFVNESPEKMAALANELPLSAVQLHGDEDSSIVEQLRPLLPEGCEIWKAHRIAEALPDFGSWPVDRHLVDTYHKESFGGVGRRFNWELLNGYDNVSELFLAGGLAPENAEKALAIGTFGLDFNSGVETAPGEKSAVKLTQLRQVLRDY